MSKSMVQVHIPGRHAVQQCHTLHGYHSCVHRIHDGQQLYSTILYSSSLLGQSLL